MNILKLISISIILLAGSIAQAQNKVISESEALDIGNQNKCCPDTSGLISGSADFSNSDLAIENPVISQNPATLDYTFKATVVDLGDDCSYCTKIVILLPAEIALKSYKAIASNGKKFKITRCKGSLIIEAGMMCPGTDTLYVHQITVTVVTSKHTDRVVNVGFGIFSYSKIADLKKENNYWSGTMP